MMGMRVWRVSMVAAVAVALAMGSLAAVPAAGQDGCCEVERLAGSDPVATAINVAQHVVADGQARRVLVARDDDFPDSLVGGSYVFDDSPILLTDQDDLDPRVAEEIRRLEPDHVTILGGTAAVSVEVEDQLVELGYPVDRIAGLSRVDTASQVALAVDDERASRDQTRWAQRKTLTFARAHAQDPSAAYADSLASAQMGAYFAYPSILSDSHQLGPVTRQFLVDHVGQFDRAFVWGGDAALSTQVTQDIREIYDGEGYRIFGPSREETALEIGLALERELADAYGSSDGRIDRALVINLRQGWEAPLVSALLAGEEPTIYLPVTGDGGQLHPATVAYVCDPANAAAYDDIGDIVVVSTTADVSNAAVDQAIEVLNGTSC